MSTGGIPMASPAPGALGAALAPQVGQPGGWKAWVSQPQNRAALVQFGIEMLQPLSPGQGVGSRIGTAIGSGAEARDRFVTGEQDRQRQFVTDRIAQQEADARSLAAQASMVNAKQPNAGTGLTAYQRIQLERGRLKDFRQFVTAKERNLFPGDVLPDVETLAQEFEQLNVSAPGGMPTATGVPTLAESVPGTGGATRVPTPEAIARLKDDPSLAGQFDEYYGAGASTRALGGG